MRCVGVGVCLLMENVCLHTCEVRDYCTHPRVCMVVCVCSLVIGGAPLPLAVVVQAGSAYRAAD